MWDFSFEKGFSFALLIIRSYFNFFLGQIICKHTCIYKHAIHVIFLCIYHYWLIHSYWPKISANASSKWKYVWLRYCFLNGFCKWYGLFNLCFVLKGIFCLWTVKCLSSPHFASFCRYFTPAYPSGLRGQNNLTPITVKNGSWLLGAG